MAAVDAYAPCPCGSGQKYKWCCQKAESYIDRADRLDRNGQHEAALGVTVDGLAKHPDVAWLHLRKAGSLMALEQPRKAVEALAVLLQKQPGHFGAIVLSVRFLLESGDLAGAVDVFQEGLGRVDPAGRGRFSALAAMLGASLVRNGGFPAGLKHLELARSLAGAEGDSLIGPPLEQARAESSTSAWAKQPYRLSSAPEGLSSEARTRFDEALGWAEQGLWRRAEAAFELLSADRNLGLCRAWLGDAPGGVEALRRHVRAQVKAGKVTTDVVDLEALCQVIDDGVGPDPIEEVDLSWPIRDRAGLLDRLAADPRCVEDEAVEGEDDAARRTGWFLLLDRPRIAKTRPDLKPSELPRVVGRIFVGPDSVVLQTRDDGGLDKVVDGFVEAAGAAIPPAQPRTKVVGSVSRIDHALDVVCFPPTDMSRNHRQRITTALLAEQVGRLWPDTPASYLDGKTPVQAAKAGGFETPLRASLLLLEESGRAWKNPPDWQALRARLNLPAEPPIDHATVVVDELHLGRLAELDPRRLDDDRLFALYSRARDWGQIEIVPSVAREIVSRRKLLERDGFPVFNVYNALTIAEIVEERRESALEWARKGRAADPSARASEVAVAWDMLELEVQLSFDPPEAWVPELVVVMDRYDRDATASRRMLLDLARFGLVRVELGDDGQPAIDASLLQHLIARFGPRVQTASGEVGVSAVRSGIWTPGGSTAAPAGKPRIILPGQ